MPTFKVVYDIPACIGCEHNSSHFPELWEMQGEKAHLKGSTRDGEQELLELSSQEEFDLHLKAAEACPVNCIHLFRNTCTGSE